ncbi:MAG: hypothetical protein U5M50_00995 [Sphingobium sp.]|nr:hypothetical protein [Sphingobium sp.]
MSSAAKGFFKEGSDGYKALETAEKTFRAVEFALSVRAHGRCRMLQRRRPRSPIAAQKQLSKAVEAINVLPSLASVPLNIAAGTATITSLAAISVSVTGILWRQQEQSAQGQ